jgi:LPS export ABC transporter protein LptC
MIARVLLLAALVALFALLVQWRLLDREAPPPAAATGRPGYFLTGVQLEEFGNDGSLRIGLESRTANEDPASGAVRLSEVEVDYHAPNGRPWRLTATAARVPPAGRLVEFEGNVRLNGMPAGRSDTAELRTEHLTLDTVAERAETGSPVELAFGRHLMQARGMRADLKAGSLRLESEVHGIFTP